MVAPTVGSGTLSRLSALATHGLPVLSVYVDLDCAGYPSVGTCERKLEALLPAIECRSAQADVRRVRQMLRTAELPFGTRGLALFSSAQGSSFDAVVLPCPVVPSAVLDEIPWLEPIASMFTVGAGRVALDRKHAPTRETTDSHRCEPRLKRRATHSTMLVNRTWAERIAVSPKQVFLPSNHSPGVSATRLPRS
jgi:hypothetical protein